MQTFLIDCARVKHGKSHLKIVYAHTHARWVFRFLFKIQMRTILKQGEGVMDVCINSRK